MSRKLLFTAAALVFAATVGVQKAQADPIVCGASQTLETLLATPDGCSIGDKVFDFNNYTGSNAAQVTVNFSNPFPNLYRFIAAPTTPWTTGFILTWAITVTDPTKRIIAIADGMDAGGTLSSDAVAFCISPPTDCQAVVNNGGAEYAVFTGLSASFLQNSAQYVPFSRFGTSNGLYGLEQNVAQTQLVAEPGSLMLLGTAFLGWGVALRRRAKARG